MNKCKYCGAEFAASVILLHEKRCKKRPDKKKASAKKETQKSAVKNEAEERGES